MGQTVAYGALESNGGDARLETGSSSSGPTSGSRTSITINSSSWTGSPASRTTSRTERPLFRDDENPTEYSCRAFFLSIALILVFSCSTIYLGLLSGLAPSASLPASVISATYFGRCSSEAGTLETNLVQTAASAGAALSNSVVYVLPAWILAKSRSLLDYKETVLISMFGGLLGICFGIPLRRIYLEEMQPQLAWPEAKAAAEIIRALSRSQAEDAAGDYGAPDPSMKIMLISAIGSFIIKFFDSGLNLWMHTLEIGKKYASGVCLYAGAEVSPGLIGIGYIIGYQTSTVILLGGIINFYIVTPIRSSMYLEEFDSENDLEYALDYWSNKTRYLGVGAMMAGALFVLLQNWKSFLSGFRQSNGLVRRTQLDIPGKQIICGILICLGPLIYIYFDFINKAWVTIVLIFISFTFSFLFSIVSAYMTGVVGSTSNPVSGIMICSILSVAFTLRGCLPNDDYDGTAATIAICAMIGCCTAVAGDMMQDLATAQKIGATPKKIQYWQTIGVIVAALIQQPIINLLVNGYGIGDDDSHPNPLAAPQATLISGVTEGVFSSNLPWDMILIGIAFAITFALINQLLVRLHFLSQPLPILIFVLGLYLPITTQIPVFLGGLVRFVVGKLPRVREDEQGIGRDGTLCASAIITGESLCGVLLAIPFAVTGDSLAIAVVDEPPYVAWVVSFSCYNVLDI